MKSFGAESRNSLRSSARRGAFAEVSFTGRSVDICAPSQSAVHFLVKLIRVSCLGPCARAGQFGLPVVEEAGGGAALVARSRAATGTDDDGRSPSVKERGGEEEEEGARPRRRRRQRPAGFYCRASAATPQVGYRRRSPNSKHTVHSVKYINGFFRDINLELLLTRWSTVSQTLLEDNNANKL